MNSRDQAAHEREIDEVIRELKDMRKLASFKEKIAINAQILKALNMKAKKVQKGTGFNL